MPKNFALVSFHKSENYGAILQAYALQHKLEELGVTAEYLDYPSHNQMTLPRKILNLANRAVRSVLGYRKRAKRTQIFRVDNIRTAKLGDHIYDGYIVGSDQVWHPGYLASSEDFFLLTFVGDDINKYSYASSFGIGQLPESSLKKYLLYLSKFKRLGIREQSGMNILRALRIEATLTPDPTLLLNDKEWSNLAAPRQTSKKYIFCYVMQGDNATAKYVKRVAKSIKDSQFPDCEIIFMGDKEFKKLRPGYHLVTDAGPREFLSYIKYAEFVITSSFHGTCFSLNFGRPFLTIQRADNPVNSRIIDLLDNIGASKRFLFSNSDLANIPAGQPDYALINRKLSSFVENGVEFLKTIVDE